MKKLLFGLPLVQTLLHAATLHIAVAANMGYAIQPLVEAFHKHYPQIEVQTTLGSSGKLTAQILHNAPYDLFLSANMVYPKTLYAKGLSLTQPRAYALGSLVLASLKPRDFSQCLQLLRDGSIKRIAMANPKTAPYGKAAQEVLLNTNLLPYVTRKLIFGESVGQTLSYTITAADVGFVAKSSLFAPQFQKLQNNKHSCEINTSLYTPIQQGMVILQHAKGKKEAYDLYHFILGKEAQTLLEKYGYTLP
jgi:molybdate transport system substrate-binding protein